MKGSIVVAKNRTYTGGKKSNSGVTLTKDQYFQLIRKIRNAAPPKADGKSGKEYETNELYHNKGENANE